MVQIRRLLLTAFIYCGVMMESSSQEYLPMVEKGKLWTYESYMPLRPENYNYTYCYWLEGDTLISDIKGVKMYKRKLQDALTQYVCTLYEVDKKVYCIYPGETQMKLLYDFDCCAGDSVFVESGHFKVVDVSKENSKGVPTKQFKLKTTISNGGMPTEMELMWIEGVGSTKDFFAMMPYDGNYYNLKSCKIDNKVFFEDNLSNDLGHISQQSYRTTIYPFYNLQGRQVQQPTRGVYIRDGRKVVVK